MVRLDQGYNEDMKINGFEEIQSWQRAKSLTIQIYKIFEKSRDYGLKDQIQRSSVSIMNNIAEGFERQSNKELRNFLYIAKGSCGEVRSMLNLALALSYINETDHKKLNELSIDTSRLLSAFIKTLTP